MSRLLWGVAENGLLDLLVDQDVRAGLALDTLDRRIDNAVLISTKPVSQYSDGLAGLIYTLSSSSLRLNAPILCRMTFSKICKMRVTFSYGSK